MANKKMTMRNYNGTTWDELHPKTTAEQVVTTENEQFISAAEKTMVANLSVVATSGNFADLNNKPTLGTAASKNTGTASGNIPVLGTDGKLDNSVVPSIAISDTFIINTQTAMLALTAQVGDVAIRTDLTKSFILKSEPASTLANWQELLTPVSAVASVAGKTGVVTLTSSDVGLGNVTNESKGTMFTSPALTGTPVAPTPAAGTNTTQIATTAYVKSQGYAPSASPALTGSPTAPTPTVSDSTTKIATTAFVQNAVQSVSSSMPKITVSASQPASPTTGDFWYEELV